MAYDEGLAVRIREVLVDRTDVQEKKMMGGLAFMVDDKMCVGVMKESLMTRIAPEDVDRALKQPGCRIMDFTGRPMKGFVIIDPEGIASDEQLSSWIALALAFNPRAKSSKKQR